MVDAYLSMEEVITELPQFHDPRASTITKQRAVPMCALIAAPAALSYRHNRCHARACGIRRIRPGILLPYQTASVPSLAIAPNPIP
jgi:hypothetical protein